MEIHLNNRKHFLQNLSPDHMNNPVCSAHCPRRSPDFLLSNNAVIGAAGPHKYHPTAKQFASQHSSHSFARPFPRLYSSSTLQSASIVWSQGLESVFVEVLLAICFVPGCSAAVVWAISLGNFHNTDPMGHCLQWHNKEPIARSESFPNSQ